MARQQMSAVSATSRQSFSAASAIRQEANSSSMYQSTTQQSYRAQGQQGSELRYERIQPVKRKTWAESSILTGGVASSLGSTYATDYHQHSCPASKVYTTESPYRYDRQNSA